MHLISADQEFILQTLEKLENKNDIHDSNQPDPLIEIISRNVKKQ